MKYSVRFTIFAVVYSNLRTLFISFSFVRGKRCRDFRIVFKLLSYFMRSMACFGKYELTAIISHNEWTDFFLQTKLQLFVGRVEAISHQLFSTVKKWLDIRALDYYQWSWQIKTIHDKLFWIQGSQRQRQRHPIGSPHEMPLRLAGGGLTSTYETYSIILISSPAQHPWIC